MGNPLSNQTILQYTNHQSSDLEPFKKHTPFGKAHTKSIDLEPFKKTQSLMWMFKSWNQLFHNWKTQICFSFLFVWKHKQTIYIFQGLVKAINEGAYSVGNYLKHIQQPKTEFC